MANEPTSQEVLKDLTKKVEDFETRFKDLEAWKVAKETQQLQYPLDFVSQQIIQGFVSVAGASYFPMGGTKGFGIYYGAGSPNTSITAAQGSLFLRTDGSSTSTRAYINTDGATAWTAVTTAT